MERYASINLSNPRQPGLNPIPASAIADTKSAHLCIPHHLALQLQLTSQGQRETTFPNGTKGFVDYVGPVKIEFNGRTGYAGGLVMGKECLVGHIVMAELDLVVAPETKRLKVNPKSPNIATSKA